MVLDANESSERERERNENDVMNDDLLKLALYAWLLLGFGLEMGKENPG